MIITISAQIGPSPAAARGSAAMAATMAVVLTNIPRQHAFRDLLQR